MASIKDIAHNAINKIPGIGRPQPGSLKKYLAGISNFYLSRFHHKLL